MIQPDQAFERLRHANPYAVAEVERLTAEEFLELVDAPMLEPVRLERRRPILAIAAALLAVIVAIPIALYTGGDGEAPPATSIQSDFAPDVPPLEAGEHLIGQYRVDQLGTQFTFESNSQWGHTELTSGYTMLLFEPDHIGTLTFVRATSLVDPASPFEPISDDSWPINDIAGWLERLDGRLVVGNPITLMIDGREVVQFDLSLDDDAPCISDEVCASFVTNRGIDDVTIGAGVPHRVWWIAQDGFEPLVVVAAGADAVVAATALMESMEFGTAQPHPIPAGGVWERGFSGAVSPGTVNLPALGGIQFGLVTEQSIDQGPDHVEIVFSPFSSVDIAYLVTGPSTNPIESIDDVVSEMESLGVAVTEVGAVNGGRVFDIVRGSSVGSGIVFTNNTESGLDRRAWAIPATGRLWLFETERGVLKLSASSYEGSFGLADVIDLAEEIAPTLTLIDPSVLPDLVPEAG